MRALKLEAGLFTVIKNPQLPVIGVVARAAIGALCLFVFIVFFVAGVALTFGIAIFGCCMAGIATGNRMHAGQREGG